MGIEVFNRYEKKFALDLDTYEKLIKRLNQYLEMDAFNKENGFYTISNIYYDTPNNELITKSLAKPIYKEKLRLRSYGVPKSSTLGYLEIKKKYNGIVNKRRTSMSIEEASLFTKTGIIPEFKKYHNKQVLNEIAFLLKRYELAPAVYIAYDRTAFFSKESRDLRITFDNNIRTRRYDLSLEAGDHGQVLEGPGAILMEIKAEQSFPLWLCKLLSEFKLLPTSFSKYGHEYTQFFYQQPLKLKGDPLLCLNPSSQQQQVQPLYL
jgi:hypothetical protein